MRKRISLKTRRPDFSRGQFRDYYENNHVPLGLQFIEHFGWLRYVRNHVVSSSGAAVTFDCYTEFWVADDSDDEALYSFLRSADFRRLDEDDRQFLDISRRLSFEMSEYCLLDNTQQAGAAVSKIVLLWKQDLADRRFVDASANKIVASLGPRLYRATLDIAVPPVPEDAPFDAMLGLELLDDDPVVLDASLMPTSRWSQLTVDPVETPTAQLLEGGSAEQIQTTRNP